MELLEDPDVKETYDKCKYAVKLWEHKFKKKNGRIPSKLDIKESPREVRQAYKTYFHLKSAVLEQSLIDIEDFNFDDETPESSHNNSENVSANVSTACVDISPNKTDNTNLENTNNENTWGSHLNHAKDTSKYKSKVESKPDINTTLSQKLFCGSKFAKRNPRKSLSFSRKKSESNLNLSSFSQPIATTNVITEPEFDISDPDISILNTNYKIKGPESNIKLSSFNIIQEMVNHKNAVQPRNNLDAGWIKRMTVENHVDIDRDLTYSQNEDSDDIIESSDEEHTIYSENKKDRLSHIDTTSPIVDSKTKRLDFSNIFYKSSKNVEVLTENIVANFNEENKMTVDEIIQDGDVDQVRDNVNLRKSPRKNKQIIQQKPNIDLPVDKTELVKLRKSTRATKKLTEIQTFSDEEVEDAFANCSDEDPAFEVNKSTGKCQMNEDSDSDKPAKRVKKVADKKDSNKPKTPKTDAKTKSRVSKVTRNKIKPEKTVESNSEEENSEYILEYSVKPRIKTVPRNSNLKKVIAARKKESLLKEIDEDTNEPLIKDKITVAKEKLEKKIASGSLNDNYVSINIKKKVFVRGKKTVNFSKFKKQAWKNKKNAMATSGPDMDMRGCDGGMLTCFNCGQIGHFAQNCKTQIGDNLLPLSIMQEEEPCPYPTLEEADKIAKEQSHELSVRKSTRIIDKMPNDSKELTSTDSNTENRKGNNDFDFDEVDDALLLAETLNIEKHMATLDVQQYVDKTVDIQTIYDLKEDGSIIDTPKEVFNALNMFGYNSFRPGQEQAIMRILSGRSTLVTLSTGSGKSLCYQLPAYLYSMHKRQPCISLVISPLVSLMEDQVTGIPSFLNAACLHTNKTKIQRAKILEEIGSGNLDILLVSPEAIVAGEKSTGFGSLLRHLPPIAFACIDEAHCLSQWSHNFRPSYLMLSRILRERLGVRTILGLTATATRATCASIVRHIGITDGGVINDRPLPDNIRLTVSKDIDRDRALLSLILSEQFRTCTSIIVYCTRREECERISSYLRTCLANLDQNKLTENSDNLEVNQNTKKRKRNRDNIHAEPYHAGLSASKRRTIQRTFMSGELRIVVATVAFGMGINKSNIRSVIHYNMPKNFESYVQEIGRAGRDGLPAHCHLFMDARGQDINELQRHIHANSMDRHVIRKLLQKVFIPCSCKIGKCPKHEVAFSMQDTVNALDIPEEIISTLLCYLELHDKRYIEVLSPAYTQCKVISYGGPAHISKAAKECPPLAMGLALYPPANSNVNSKLSGNVAEFPVIEIAAAIGWDSGICKHKLKNLEWTSESGQPKRSPLSVQFTQLGFRLLAPGNLTPDELDTALDSLYARVVSQEYTAVSQLRAVHTALSEATMPSFKACLEQNEGDSDREEKLKERVRAYFDAEEQIPLPETNTQQPKVDIDRISADTRALVCMYRDNSFTGRSVARIFHGIQSPNYPAVIWGRCRFWRSHLSEDFNEVCRIATSEIIKMR